jgi:SAM-dependent methyltransferase
MLRPLTRLLARFDLTRGWLARYYDARSERAHRHPIDVHYGIQTSSTIPGYALARDAGETTAYTGSQPSIIRSALALVDQPERTVLVDLGCGKGRVLAVASEFPFREIVGVEISPPVSAMAEANMAIVRRAFPGRSPIRIVTGDASVFPLPAEPLAIFLYRPFGEAGTRRLLAHIEAALTARSEPLTIVYYNPVWGGIFDESPLLTRAHARTIPYDPSEIGYGPDTSDTVVVWKDRRCHPGDVAPEAQRKIVVVQADWRAELAPA